MKIKEWFTIWFKAARAPFLVVSFIPCLLGGAIAYAHGYFNLGTFVLVTIGIVSAHSAADFVDDYFDYFSGNLGNKEKQFHDSPLIDGKVTPRQVFWASLLFLGIALAVGVYLFIKLGFPVLIMAGIGAFIVMFYTSPPVKLNYRGLGETMLFIAFGPLIVFGVYFILTGQFSWEPILASIPPGIFTMNVGLVSNTFDYLDDVESGKRTIPVRFGQTTSVNLILIVTIVGFLVIIASPFFHGLPWWIYLMLPTLPIAIKVVQKTSMFEDASNYTTAMGSAIALSSLAGILLVAGYIVQIMLGGTYIKL